MKKFLKAQDIKRMNMNKSKKGSSNKMKSKENLSVEEKREKAVNILKYYNKLYGASYKVSDNNINCVLDNINVENKDELIELRIFMDRLSKDDDDYYTFQEVIEKFVEYKYQKEQEEKNKPIQAQASLETLEKCLAEIFVKSKSNLIEDELVNKCVEIAKQKIYEEYGAIKKNVVLNIDDKKIKFKGEILHNKFDEVLKFVNKDEPVFLTGEAGTGKNYLCKQIAKALGLDFYFTNAVTQEYKLTGFTDAMGKYQETQFYKAFKNGGLFMLDEVDASIPEVLVILNSAIANKYFDFPAPIGYVEAHKNFRVIAAGNTYGDGASYQYVGRNQLDGASLDRFACVHIGYDEEIEKTLCNNDEDLLYFIRTVRKICSRKNIQLIVSYRAISRLYKLNDGSIPLDELLNTCLFKNVTTKELQYIIDDYPKDDIYKTAMCALTLSE